MEFKQALNFFKFFIVKYPGDLDFDVKDFTSREYVSHTVKKTCSDIYEVTFIPKSITDYLIKIYADEVKRNWLNYFCCCAIIFLT
jgi:hypothetical protein